MAFLPTFGPPKTDEDGFGLGGLSLALQALGAGVSAYSAYDKSKSDRAAYEYQAGVERNRAQVMDWQAADAISRGQDEAYKYGLKAAQVAGNQRARFAAGNKALDEGSPYNILSDTDYVAHVDLATIGDNAAKEAWALRMSAQSTRSNAAMLDKRARAEKPVKAGATSLLASAGSVASSWYKMRGGLAP